MRRGNADTYLDVIASAAKQSTLGLLHYGLLRFARNDGLKFLRCLKIESERNSALARQHQPMRRPGEGRDPCAAASRYAPLLEGFIDIRVAGLYDGEGRRPLCLK
jgi:hypothetical protein